MRRWQDGTRIVGSYFARMERQQSPVESARVYHIVMHGDLVSYTRQTTPPTPAHLQCYYHPIASAHAIRAEHGGRLSSAHVQPRTQSNTVRHLHLGIRAYAPPAVTNNSCTHHNQHPLSGAASPIGTWRRVVRQRATWARCRECVLLLGTLCPACDHASGGLEMSGDGAEPALASRSQRSPPFQGVVDVDAEMAWNL